MPDLAAQIRERLDELAAPLLPQQFAMAPEDWKPEEVALWQRKWDDQMAESPDAVQQVIMLPHTAKWEPLPDPCNAALLAVLELHRQVTDCFDEVCENCNGWSGAVAYWPCPTVRAIADKLGIEVDHA